MAYGEIYHRLVFGRVPYGLWRPSTADIAECLGEELVNTHFFVCPVYQVVGCHQHQAAVVAPTVFVGPFPLCRADAFRLAEHMQVGHGDIEPPVGATIDMRVADAMLVGYGVAGDDRFRTVYGGEGVAVVADSHKQRVCCIIEIGEKVGTHVFL